MNDKLSVIIPYAQEGANTLFTCRSIHEELLGINHEIVVVDNMCEELLSQLHKKNQVPDKGHDHVDKNNEPIESHLKAMSKRFKWLKYLKYDKALSHWQCKTYAIENTDSYFIMFVDAHCLCSQNSISGMFEVYKTLSATNNITFHLPLTYHLLDDKRLIYSLQHNLDGGFVGYQFCGTTNKEDWYEVPCMSSCGCMLTRDIYNKMFDSWKYLKSYGGGENILNFVLSIQGIKHYIYNKGTLFHHGDTRGYHWNWDGFHFNRGSAMYLIGGDEFLNKYLSTLKGNPKILDNIRSSILETYKDILSKVELHKVLSIEKYVKEWSDKSGG